MPKIVQKPVKNTTYRITQLRKELDKIMDWFESVSPQNYNDGYRIVEDAKHTLAQLQNVINTSDSIDEIRPSLESLIPRILELKKINVGRGYQRGVNLAVDRAVADFILVLKAYDISYPEEYAHAVREKTREKNLDTRKSIQTRFSGLKPKLINVLAKSKHGQYQDAGDLSNAFPGIEFDPAYASKINIDDVIVSIVDQYRVLENKLLKNWVKDVHEDVANLVSQLGNFRGLVAASQNKYRDLILNETSFLMKEYQDISDTLLQTKVK